MSDPRIESAKENLQKGAFDQVIQILKPMLGEMPDNIEIRNILTEAQEGMMLRLQLSGKVKKASEMLGSGDVEGAKKAVAEVLKMDPTNPEALEIDRTLHAPPVDDLSATIDFGVSDDAFHEAISAPISQDRDDAGLDQLEDFSLPMEGIGQQPAESPLESTKNSDRKASQVQDFAPMELEDFGGAAPASQSPVTAVSEMEDFGGAPLSDDFSLPSAQGFEGLGSPARVEPSTSAPMTTESTMLSSDAAVPFSFGGEGGKVESFLAEGKSLISSGKYQEAIDVLTRIFILDEENQDAQKLIDQAKELEVNREREINLILNEAISAYDAKSYDNAKSLFQKVLTILPGHREADYYLKEMENAAGAGAPAFELETPAAPSSSPFQLEGGPADFSFDASGGGAGEDLASLVGHPAPPPTPAPATAESVSTADFSQQEVPSQSSPFKVHPPAQKSKKKGGKRAPVGIIAAVIGGLLVVSSLFFVGPMLWDKLFSPKPKAMSIPPAKPVKQPEAKPQPKPPVTPPAPQKSIAEIITDAKTAMEEKQYQKAVDLLTEVEKLDKNNLDVKAMLPGAREALAAQQAEAAKNQKFIVDYEKAVQYFKMQEYGEALRISWRLVYPDDTLAKQMGKADTIRKIIRNGYYNWGVKELKAGNPLAAKKNFQDLLDSSQDPKGRELLEFSKKYNSSNIDEKYRSYVQELSFRSLEE